jgi:hypothetical protein
MDHRQRRRRLQVGNVDRRADPRRQPPLHQGQRHVATERQRLRALQQQQVGAPAGAEAAQAKPVDALPHRQRQRRQPIVEHSLPPLDAGVGRHRVGNLRPELHERVAEAGGARHCHVDRRHLAVVVAASKHRLALADSGATNHGGGLRPLRWNTGFSQPLKVVIELLSTLKVEEVVFGITAGEIWFTP